MRAGLKVPVINTQRYLTKAAQTSLTSESTCTSSRNRIQLSIHPNDNRRESVAEGTGKFLWFFLSYTLNCRRNKNFKNVSKPLNIA